MQCYLCDLPSHSWKLNSSANPDREGVEGLTTKGMHEKGRKKSVKRNELFQRKRKYREHRNLITISLDDKNHNAHSPAQQY
jgi:hypothetical protein